MKKGLFTLLVLFLATSLTFAQEKPKLSGIAGVDSFAKKAISTLTEYNNIQTLLDNLNVTKKGDKVEIKDKTGANLEPKESLTLLDKLAARIKNQGGNLKDLISLKDNAASAVKNAKMMKKAKGTKTLKSTVELEKFLIENTKVQGESVAEKIKLVSSTL